MRRLVQLLGAVFAPLLAAIVFLALFVGFPVGMIIDYFSSEQVKQERWTRYARKYPGAEFVLFLICGFTTIGVIVAVELIGLLIYWIVR
jgi:hypothetical protein